MCSSDYVFPWVHGIWFIYTYEIHMHTPLLAVCSCTDFIANMISRMELGHVYYLYFLNQIGEPKIMSTVFIVNFACKVCNKVCFCHDCYFERCEVIWVTCHCVWFMVVKSFRRRGHYCSLPPFSSISACKRSIAKKEKTFIIANYKRLTSKSYWNLWIKSAQFVYVPRVRHACSVWVRQSVGCGSCDFGDHKGPLPGGDSLCIPSWLFFHLSTRSPTTKERSSTFLLWYRLTAARYFAVQRQEFRRFSSIQLISSSRALSTVDWSKFSILGEPKVMSDGRTASVP